MNTISPFCIERMMANARKTRQEDKIEKNQKTIAVRPELLDLFERAFLGGGSSANMITRMGRDAFK